MRTVKIWLSQLPALLVSAVAFAEYDIGETEAGIYKRLNTFMQDSINFTINQIIATVVLFGSAWALFSWYNKPEKSESLGKTLRAVIAAIFLLGITIAIKYIKELT